MKIAICGSLDFTTEMLEMKNSLEKLGHEARMPFTAVKIINGEITLEQIKNSKDAGKMFELSIKNNAIRKWFSVIKESEAILVLNYDKKGIKNYIGGNTFLEIGFAHILDKKKFILNPLPELSYVDEIYAMETTVLNGDLSKID